jgi:hypothetical protein
MQETQKFYYVYQCSKSSELRGRKYEGGCGWWNLRTSKIPLKSTLQIQGNCKRCKRRPRVNPRAVKTYFDRGAAQIECNARNGIFEGEEE